MHCLGFFFILYTPLVKPTKHARLVNWSNLISLLNSSFLSNNDEAWRVKTRKFHSSSEFAENLIWSIKLSIFFSFLENRYVFHQNVRFLPKLHEAVRDVLHGNPLLEIPRYEMRPMATITGNFTVRDASHGKPIPDIPRYEKRHTAISTGYSTVRDASYSNLSGEFHDRRHTRPPIRGNFTLRDASHGNPVLDT